MSDENVTSIRGELPKVKKPSPGAVAALTDTLEQAQAGQIIGVGVVFMNHDGTCGWVMGGTVGGFTMAGAAVQVVHEIQKMNDKDDETYGW